MAAAGKERPTAELAMTRVAEEDAVAPDLLRRKIRSMLLSGESMSGSRPFFFIRGWRR